MTPTFDTEFSWPDLQFERYKDTLQTVHLWTQIVGKIRLRQLPWINHSWHVTLYISPRGLTTGSMPYADGTFGIELDFMSHEVIITTDNGQTGSMPLYSRSVADFYGALFDLLRQTGVVVRIYARPNEMVEAIPFSKDQRPRRYDKGQMELLFRALAKANVVFTQFRAGFTGKVSPVHFFWGGFDLAVTRFSGREAPKHPGGIPNIPDDVMQEAYSHEVSSCGFWPGDVDLPMPVFYSYCYPTPAAFGHQPVEPDEAYYSVEKGEFFLPYAAVRQSREPEQTLMRFLNSTYIAAAVTGDWDTRLECDLAHYKRPL